MTALTKEEAISCYEIIDSHILLLELDRPPEKFHMSGGIESNIIKPVSLTKRQENSAESARVIKMYEFESDQERDDAFSAHPKLRKIKIGDRITFMDYAAPRGPYANYPEIRVMSCDDVMSILRTDKPIMD